MAQSRMILVEFNELSPVLLERFMGKGHLPNFQRFYNRAQIFVSEADAEPPNLNPWVQWYSVHTGIRADVHGVHNLTDGPRADHVDLWRALLEGKRRVGNCSSMNAKRFEARGSYFIPDPWCDTEEAYPEHLDRFVRFVRHYVREYTRREQGLGLKDYVDFATYMALHGLRPCTVAALVRQLVRERVVGSAETWRRAPLLDRLQFDLFRHYQNKLRPDFATFFANSTAHYQHAYWRHMEPEAFTVEVPEEDRVRYSGAILFGYRCMDRVLGEFLGLAGGDTLLVLVTALSQQPFTRYEDQGGQHFYRPRDGAGFLRLLDVEFAQLQPVMTHQYIARFATGSSREAAGRQLRSCEVDGQPLIDLRLAGDGGLYFGSQVATRLPENATLTWSDGRSVPFFELFYRIEGTKSGCHHPDGALWFMTGSHYRHNERVSVVDIFPTVLDFFSVALTPEEAALRVGRSLLPRFDAAHASTGRAA